VHLIQVVLTNEESSKIHLSGFTLKNIGPLVLRAQPSEGRAAFFSKDEPPTMYTVREGSFPMLRDAQLSWFVSLKRTLKYIRY